jgi:FtsP/CotA-like multicopper oxidase with cupredoxin domain
VVVAIAAGWTMACATPSEAPPLPRPCDATLGRPNDGALAPSADLYCMQLTPAPGVEGSATVELGRIPGPFTVAVTPEGHHRYRAHLTLEDVPEPETVGGEGLVAWVADATLFPEERLGVVRPGTTELGEISMDKFLVIVTAEADTTAAERSGRILFRATSPSARMQPADLFEFAMGSLPGGGEMESGMGEDPGGAMEGAGMAGGMAMGPDPSGWLLPPMPEGVGMLPRMMTLRPSVGPLEPGDLLPPDAPAPLPARPYEIVRLADGDVFDLEATVVEREIDGHTARMYAYNGQYPGPLIWVEKGTEITVNFTNSIDHPTTVHWHGLRLDNASDGIPGVTQDPVEPGETFTYTLLFPDAGLYWYHPHMREDLQQDGGLYGNMMVRDGAGDTFGPAHREEILMLDDLLVADGGAADGAMAEGGLVQWGRERATHGFMGRFGNRFLVNGAPGWDLRVDRGEVVRFFLTNVANTRTFNLSFVHEETGEEAPLKIVGSDIGTYQYEERVPSIVISPAERYMAHARFDRPGRWLLMNRVRGIDHLFGSFFQESDTLGVVTVGESMAVPAATTVAFDDLRVFRGVRAEIESYREHFDRPVDRELEMVLETQDLPFFMQRLMAVDSAYFHPVEWSGTMPRMNWWSTDHEARWQLLEPSTGRINMDIRWDFELGSIEKIRIRNRRRTLHGMQHPIHFHGQRFLVLSVNGVPNENLVWKDTVLVPVGATIDILLESTNPGEWMAHCHIAEHLESGMMLGFGVS